MKIESILELINQLASIKTGDKIKIQNTAISKLNNDFNGVYIATRYKDDISFNKEDSSEGFILVRLLQNYINGWITIEFPQENRLYEAGMREEVEFYLREVHGVENPDPELVNEIVEEIADSSKVTQAIDECSEHIIKMTALENK